MKLEGDMNWQEVCEHPILQNLPFKIELNKDGEIIMNAGQVNHSLYAWEIMRLLGQFLKGGKCPPEFPIMTSDNVKSPDVAWISNERLQSIWGMSASTIAPEICVEIKSPSNTWKKLHEKAQLYFEKAATEVWFCSEEGKMEFYSSEGKLVNSVLVPEFPEFIDLQPA